MVSSPTQISAPTSQDERVAIVDVLRGLALIGVILANFQGMISWDNPAGIVDPAAIWFLENVVSGKFFRLFAFMFGLGFALQMARLEARGIRFVPLYFRRLLILGLIGVAHGILFWPNDILALFAQFGLLLLLIRRVSNRALAIIAFAALFAPHAYYYASTGFADFQETAQESELSADEAERNRILEEREAETHRVRSEGSYAEVVTWNTEYFIRWHTNIQGQFAILAEEFLMFLLGFFAGRRRLYEDKAENTSFLRKVIWWSLAAAIAAQAAMPVLRSLGEAPAHGHLADTARYILADVRPAALALFYAAAATLLLRRFQLTQRLKLIGALGRMALTNYILLSILVTTLFYDYGFGLYGDVTAATGVACATMATILMMVTSSWWLERFRFGPAEWLWRSLTYGKRQQVHRGNGEREST